MEQTQLQRNAITKVAYEGGNQATLLNAKDKNNYQSNEWITFLQARSRGLQLVNAKGKGEHIRFFAEGEDVDAKGKAIIVRRPRYYVVFNMDLTKEVEEITENVLAIVEKEAM